MYQPTQEVVERYADVLIRFALHGGSGVKPGEVVFCAVPDCALPMYGALQDSILRVGANPLMVYVPLGMKRRFYDVATEEQVAFFPEEYWKGVVAQADHRLTILPRETLHEMEGVPPAKIMTGLRSVAPMRKAFNQKEALGKLSWTLALWGTQELADEAKMTLQEYWEQIILACNLDLVDPIKRWQEIFAENSRVREALNVMKIARLHVEGPEVDLWITIGQKRRWVGGSGRNIPSYEIFISPDWRGTEGWIRFNQPLYYQGQLITGIELAFSQGSVTNLSAKSNEATLRTMVMQPNANHIGEFSLTDGRFSRILRPMCVTLFDENIGGPQGNMHLALGMSYRDAYDGDAALLTAVQWAALGFNDVDCPIHTDIMATSPRRVTAFFEDGSPSHVVIYENGQFTI